MMGKVAQARWVQMTRDQSNPVDAILCLVTGASAGLGRATASRLAGMEAHVAMVCRDRTRGEAARDEIKSRSKNESVDLMLADLSLLASVRNLAAEFGAKYSKRH